MALSGPLQGERRTRKGNRWPSKGHWQPCNNQKARESTPNMTGRRLPRTMEVIPRHPWKSKSPCASRPTKASIIKGTQGVRVRYDTVLPPSISIVWSPGRPVISVPKRRLWLSPGSLRLGVKFPGPFFGQESPALTSINRRESAVNAEIASINVWQRPIFCDVPSFPTDIPDCPPFTLAPTRRGFSARFLVNKGPGNLTPKIGLLEGQSDSANT